MPIDEGLYFRLVAIQMLQYFRFLLSLFIYWQHELMGSFSDYIHCGFLREMTIKYNYCMNFFIHSVLIQQIPIECTLQTEISLLYKKYDAFLTFRGATRSQNVNMYFQHNVNIVHSA